MSIVDGMPGWQVALVNVAAIAGVIVGGTTLARPLFRFIAGSRLREMFTATALFVVVGIAFLMTLVGLSPALGTFLAGVVLANSEYRHELESDIEPFKGLLLGLFFITVGAGIDFEVLFGDFATILGLTLGLMAAKALVLFGLGVAFGLRGADRWLLALGLAQAGEFAFVLLSFTVQNAVLPQELADTLLLVVALSMVLTPGFFIFFDRVILPRLTAEVAREQDEITEQGVAIIAGVGRFGQISNRILLANGFKTVVLDSKAEFIETMRKFGVRSFYGDASRPDLLHAAGLQDARLLVVAIDDPERTLQIVELARRENPKLHIIARAHDRLHVYRLFQAGADDIVRETFDSAVRAARYGLEALGIHPYEAEKITTVYVEEDKIAMRELAELWDPEVPVSENAAYVARAREVNLRAEAAMQGDRSAMHDKSDRAWSPPIPDGGAVSKAGE
jgi:voltage-gated potassium channel Kch